METTIKFGGQEFSVRRDTKGNVSMTDLWRVAGSDQSKLPAKWQTHDKSIGFIQASAAFLKCDSESLFITTKGRNGSTFAHPLIALEYSRYLDAALAVIVNQNFLERIEEEKNPDLIADRYIRTWKKKGMDDAWIGDRFQGITTRNLLTSTLKKHGVQHEGYRNVTNAIYNPLYGGTSNVVREKKGLDKKDNIRDNLPRLELRAIELAEMLAVETIENNGLTGNAQCEIAASKAGRVVANALMQNRQK